MMKTLKVSSLVLMLLALPIKEVCATKHANSLQKAESKAEEAIGDTIITAKIKEAFLEDPDIASLKIHVKTHNQVVILTGTVNSQIEKRIAINIAESVEGVKVVDSKIKIKKVG
jgi:hyperosmotically inducible protein